MKKPKFEKGEMCFFEFDLVQVLETKEDKITEVSDGSFRTSSIDLSDRCFPVDLQIKVISEVIKYTYDRLTGLKSKELNYADLNRELVKRWVVMCENKDDGNKVGELLKSLEGWLDIILEKA